MAQMIDLDQVERKTWTRNWEDGLVDINFGLLLLAVGVSGMALRTDLPAPWPLVIYCALAVCALLFQVGGKLFITLPRLGRVRPGPRAKARRNKVLIAYFVSVGLMLLLFLLSVVMWNRGVSREDSFFHVTAVAATLSIVLLSFGLGAYFLEFNRMYLIGILFTGGVGGMLLYEMEGMDSGIYVTFAAAAVVVIMGIVIFIRFLRSHPVPAMEDANDKP